MVEIPVPKVLCDREPTQTVARVVEVSRSTRETEGKTQINKTHSYQPSSNGLQSALPCKYNFKLRQGSSSSNHRADSITHTTLNHSIRLHCWGSSSPPGCIQGGRGKGARLRPYSLARLVQEATGRVLAAEKNVLLQGLLLKHPVG